MADTAIGSDEPDEQQSGIDDEAHARETRKDGKGVGTERQQPDLTREDIESGNDRNVSVDQGNRSGKTNRLPDEGVEIN